MSSLLFVSYIRIRPPRPESFRNRTYSPGKEHLQRLGDKCSRSHYTLSRRNLHNWSNL